MSRPAKTVGTEIRYGSAVLAVLLPDRLRKTIEGSRHILRKPGPSLCIALLALERAEHESVDLVEIVDVETNASYWATIPHIRAAGFPVSRGHGPQLGLPLSEWSPTERQARQWAPPVSIEQLGLFQGER